MDHTAPSRSLVLFLLVVAVSLTGGCGRVLVEALKQAGARKAADATDEELNQMFMDLNDACPRRVDFMTDLVEVRVVGEKHVEFHYRVKYTGKQLKGRFDKQLMYEKSIEQIKDQPIADVLAERDICIDHIYRTKDNLHLTSFSVDKSVILGSGSKPTGQLNDNPFAQDSIKGAPGSIEPGPDAVADEASRPVLDDPGTEAIAEPDEPSLPERYQPPKRSRRQLNQVQSNPFFSDAK